MLFRLKSSRTGVELLSYFGQFSQKFDSLHLLAEMLFVLHADLHSVFLEFRLSNLGLIMSNQYLESPYRIQTQVRLLGILSIG